MINNLLLIASRSNPDTLAAAKALESLLDPNRFNVEVCYEWKESLLDKAIRGSYPFWVGHRPLWHLTNNDGYSKFLSHYASSSVHRNKGLFEKYIADMVVSLDPMTHLMAMRLGALFNIPCAAFVLTPFLVHHSQVSKGLDYYLVPLEKTGDLVNITITLRDIQVLTFPVKKEF